MSAVNSPQQQGGESLTKDGLASPPGDAAVLSPVPTASPPQLPLSDTAQIREKRERRRSSHQLGVNPRVAAHLDTALLRRASLSVSNQQQTQQQQQQQSRRGSNVSSTSISHVGRAGGGFKAFEDPQHQHQHQQEQEQELSTSAGTFGSGIQSVFSVTMMSSLQTHGEEGQEDSFVAHPPASSHFGSRPSVVTMREPSAPQPPRDARRGSKRMSRNSFSSEADPTPGDLQQEDSPMLESVASGLGIRRRLSFDERRDSALARRASDFIRRVERHVSAQERIENQLSRFEELNRQATQEDVRSECAERWTIVLTTYLLAQHMLDRVLQERARRSLQMMLSPLLLRRAVRLRRTKAILKRIEDGDFHPPTAHDLMKNSVIFAQWPPEHVTALLETSASPTSFLPGMCIVYEGEQAKQTGMYIVVEGFLTEIPSTDDVERYLEGLPQALYPVKTDEETRARRKRRRLSTDASVLQAEKFTAPELFPSLFQPYVPPPPPRYASSPQLISVPMTDVVEETTITSPTKAKGTFPERVSTPKAPASSNGGDPVSPERLHSNPLSPVASFRSFGPALTRQKSKKALNPFQIQVIANMATYNPGGVIGDEAVLLHRSYQRSVRCQTPVVAYYIPYKAVIDRLRMLPVKYQQDILNSAKVHARNVLSRLIRPTVEALRASHPIFARWNAHSLLNLTQLMSPSVIRGGDRFVGDIYKCGKIFIVFSGEIFGDSNRHRTRLRFGPGSILCIESVMMYAAPPELGEEVSLVAGTFCELWTINRTDFMMSMQRNKIFTISQQDAVEKLAPELKRFATLEMVKRISLFAPLSDRTASNIATAFSFRVSCPDEYLTLQGYSATDAFILLHGVVKQVHVEDNDSNPNAILKNAHNPTAAVSGVFAKGDVGQEVTQLFSGASFLVAEALLGAKQHVSCISVTSCLLLKASRHRLLEILADKENKYCTLDDVLASARAVIDSRVQLGIKTTPPQEPIQNTSAERNKDILDAQRRAAMRVDAFRALHGDLSTWNQEEAHLTAVDIAIQAKSREKTERAERFRKHRQDMTKMTIENRIFASVSTQMFHFVRDPKEQERTEYFRNGVDEHLPQFFDDEEEEKKKKTKMVTSCYLGSKDVQCGGADAEKPLDHVDDKPQVAAVGDGKELPQALHLPKLPSAPEAKSTPLHQQGHQKPAAPYRRANCGFTLSKTGELVFTESLKEDATVGASPQSLTNPQTPSTGSIGGSWVEGRKAMVGMTPRGGPAFERLHQEEEKRQQQQQRIRNQIPVVMDPIALLLNTMSRVNGNTGANNKMVGVAPQQQQSSIKDPRTHAPITRKYTSLDTDNDEALMLSLHRRVDVRLDLGGSAMIDNGGLGGDGLSKSQDDGGGEPTAARTRYDMITSLQASGVQKGKNTMTRLGVPQPLADVSIAKRELREDPVATLLESVGLKAPLTSNLASSQLANANVVFHVPADSAKLSLRRGQDFSRTFTRLCNDAQQGDVFSSHYDRLMVNRMYTVIRPPGAQIKGGTVMTDGEAVDESGKAGDVVEYESDTSGSPRRSRGKPYIHHPSKEHVRMTRKEYYSKRPFKQLNHEVSTHHLPPPPCGSDAKELPLPFGDLAVVRTAPISTRRTTAASDPHGNIPLKNDSMDVDEGSDSCFDVPRHEDGRREREGEESTTEEGSGMDGSEGEESGRDIATRGRTDTAESALSLHRMTPTSLHGAL